jgi:FixJ family two-component response regulator
VLPCVAAARGPAGPVDAGRGLRGRRVTPATVFVVDDDPSVREALSSLIRSVGLRVETFATAEAFLPHARSDAAACVVLDVRLGGSNGLELQRELARIGEHIPIIFITGHGDIPMSVGAMKAGAIDFLAKPFREQDLLDAIAQGLRRDEAARRSRSETAELLRRFSTLTARERDVTRHVVDGLLNKQIAAVLGVSEITVKVHRHNVMGKMNARSLPELVRMIAKLA